MGRLINEMSREELVKALNLMAEYWLDERNRKDLPFGLNR
jgi:hypothetical protein